jgi:hypothetical protein
MQGLFPPPSWPQGKVIVTLHIVGWNRPRYFRFSRRRNMEIINFESGDSVKLWFLSEF